MNKESAPDATQPSVPATEAIPIPSVLESASQIQEAGTQTDKLTISAFTEEQKRLFAEHVQLVARKGDALSTFPCLTGEVLVGKISGVTGAAAGLELTLADNAAISTVAMTTGVLVGATVVAGGLTIMAWEKWRHLPQATARVNGNAQEKLGERYEFHVLKSNPDGSDLKRPQLALWYYGPIRALDENFYVPTCLERVQRMAQIAEENGISQIILSPDAAQAAIEDVPEPINVADLLTATGVKVGDRSGCRKIEVVMKPPQFWLEATEKKFSQVATREQEKIIGSLIDRLHAVSPGHPISEAYRYFADYEPDVPPSYRKSVLRRLVQESIQREFSEGSFSGINMKSEAHDAGMTQWAHRTNEYWDARLSVSRQKVNGWVESLDDNALQKSDYMLQAGAVDASTIGHGTAKDGPGSTDHALHITWTDAIGHLVGSADFEELLNMSRSDMELLITNATDENYPLRDQTRQLLLMLIAQQLEHNKTVLDDKLREISGIGERQAPDAFTDFQGDTVFDALLPRTGGELSAPIEKMNSTPLATPTLKRTILGLCCGFIIGGGVFFGGDALENAHDSAIEAARAQLAAEYGVSASQVPARQAEPLARKNSTGALLFGVAKDFQEPLDSLFSPKAGIRFNTGSAAGSSNGQASFGNVRPAKGNDPARADWLLRANGNISAAGYWASGLSHQVSIGDDGLLWLNDTQQPSVTYNLPTSLGPFAQPSILAERELTKDDAVNKDPNHPYLPIPVRTGTRPVAANLDGQPVHVLSFNSGLYGVEKTDKSQTDHGHLQYWVVEDSDAPKPHATDPIQLIAEPGNSIDISGIKTAWENAIPGFADATTQAQEVMMRQYIKEHFTYRLDPFPPNFNMDAKTDPGDFTQRVITNGEGNCSVGNGLVAVSTVDGLEPDVVVNPSTGYLNKSGRGEKTLTSREQHMMNVGPNGEDLDSTPSNDITPEDAAYLDGREGDTNRAAPEQPALTLLNLGLVALATGAVVLAIGRRRKIGKKAKDIHGRRADFKKKRKEIQAAHQEALLEEELRGKDSSDLHAVSEVIQAALYDPKQDVQAALQRSATSPIPPSDARQRLQRPSMFDSIAQASIKHLHNQATEDEQRQVLSRALAVIGLSQRIQQFSK